MVYDLVAANTDERQAAEVVLQRVQDCDIFGDKGFLGDDWQADFLTYEVPTYFGMICASFVPKA